MQQLKPFEKNYVIVFTDDSTMEVTEQVAMNVIKMSTMPNQVGTTIAGNFYKFTMIAKVLDLAEYYRQYPDMRPEATPNLFPDTGKPPLEKYGTSKGAMEGIIVGIKKYISEQRELGKETPNADNLLLEAEKRLAKLA